MKKTFCLLFLIALMSYATARAEERPKEFQGVIWGTHISKVDGLVLKKEPSLATLPREILEKIEETARERKERGEKTYLRTSDILSVPGGEVKAIEYIFAKDQLAQGIISFSDFQQYLSFVKIYGHLYGTPDEEEKNEAMIQQSWHAKNEDEADVILFYDPLIKAGFVLMKCGAFLGKEPAFASEKANWQILKEDDNGMWFYDFDRQKAPNKNIFKIKLKCNLSVKRQNELRVSLKSKILPNYVLSLEEIKCSSKETRNLQSVILSEKGPLRTFQNFQNSKLQPIAPGSMAEALYNKVCQ